MNRKKIFAESKMTSILILIAIGIGLLFASRQLAVIEEGKPCISDADCNYPTESFICVKKEFKPVVISHTFTTTCNHIGEICPTDQKFEYCQVVFGHLKGDIISPGGNLRPNFGSSRAMDCYVYGYRTEGVCEDKCSDHITLESKQYKEVSGSCEAVVSCPSYFDSCVFDSDYSGKDTSFYGGQSYTSTAPTPCLAYALIGSGNKICPVEICSNLLDDDGDGGIDCADPECPPPVCESYQTAKCIGYKWACLDNCLGADLSCGAQTCQNCNSIDGCQGSINYDYYCLNRECKSSQDDCSDCSCSCNGYNIQENTDLLCSDGKDNDCDQMADCTDPGCASFCTEKCTNGIDDDKDGKIDCQDPDCPDVCNDCESASCVNYQWKCTAGCTLTSCINNNEAWCSLCSSTSEISCTDSKDNDCDGFTDCDDTECRGTSNCPIDCPYQCCYNEPQYNDKSCAAGYSCANHVCTSTQVACPFSCCVDESAYTDKYCSAGEQCAFHTCQPVTVACPYQCCVGDGVYIDKYCQAGSTCTYHECVPDLVSCPYECCVSDAGFISKKCGSGYTCESHECVSLFEECPENFECCDGLDDYKVERCPYGYDCRSHVCYKEEGFFGEIPSWVKYVAIFLIIIMVLK